MKSINGIFLMVLAMAFLVCGNAVAYDISPARQVQDGETEYEVRGIVTDNNGPVAGVTVFVKDTQNGVSTEPDGRFVLKGVKLKDVIVVSMIGYRTVEIRYRGQNSLDVVISEEAVMMDRVVVTALGIERDRMALSYNLQEVNSDKLTKVKDANVVNSLIGKVAGVQITVGAGGQGSSTRVVMRGTKSIEKSNNALYVIDGIPMYNYSYGGSGGTYGGAIGSESALGTE